MPRHCDSYISSISAPTCLRWYLLINRLPAVDKYLCFEKGVEDPKLFAKYEGKWVRVVMASRMGDLGITEDLNADRGYNKRVSVEDLTDFTDQKPV